MSKYTVEVRYICESYAGLSENAGFNDVDEIINQALPKIFNFDFPIFDENYRDKLCAKILKYYYTREICCETVGLWKLFLCNKLNEIMPYYNQMYESAKLEFNPLFDTEYTRSGNRNNEGTTRDNRTTNQNDESTNRELFSDTPQGSLDNVENETYLTTATKRMNDSSGTSTTTANVESQNDEIYSETVKGKFGGVSYSKMLNEYRRTFVNIDAEIIKDLSDLFMNLW